jgi:hypothetical protein
VLAGLRLHHGSNSPEFNIVFEGLMYHPLYLFGSAALGVLGAYGMVALQRDWKYSREMNLLSMV